MNTIWRVRGKAHVIGHDVPHDGGIMPKQVVQARIVDPAQLIPHLFEDYRSGFMQDVKPGDIIVSGRNFGCGKPHTNGYIAMKALGLHLLCESVSSIVRRALMNLGQPCLQPCPGISEAIAQGDDVEVDYETGTVMNLTSGTRLQYSAMDDYTRQLIEQGGQKGLLLHWLQTHPELAEPMPPCISSTAAGPALRAVHLLKEI
ncbi:3-isopropylmalate dehydratase small subunit [Pigmentiphaga soli]|uniref:3-isopropylmalate dehydratase small subunit n=1 Tax=Pigmentiphaga soli TaxID=1007095 RepID=A0ABP8HJ75_9BURK